MEKHTYNEMLLCSNALFVTAGAKESPGRVPGLQGHEEISRGEVLDSPTLSKTVSCAIRKGVEL
jgi:hypothetical protein